MTQTIVIDGPVVTINNDREFCIGYYKDGVGDVIGRFAVPQGEHEVNKNVESVEYVNSLDSLPTIADKYRDSNSPPT